MQLLSTLTPAETLLVLEGQKAMLKELLKMTLMDLLLKQVLRIVKVTQTEEPDKSPYLYIAAGASFEAYSQRPHESIFLKPYRQASNNQILFRNLIRLAYDNSGGQSRYQATVSQRLPSFFTRSIGQFFFGGFSLSEKGIEARKTIQSNILELEERLPRLIQEQHPEALTILKTIHGNIFLLKNLEFELIKKIDQQLLEEINHEIKRDEQHTASGCSVWIPLDTSYYAFDSSYGGADSTRGDDSSDGGWGSDSSDSGSGDSGCSSGCGGCGGGD